ncbi:MAG: hypothetical protein DMF54_00075 [Acidobacteria bacterium]|nr:MAG: hypothetical protein DMF54_00075 [Acidobacteriota bacterium]
MRDELCDRLLHDESKEECVGRRENAAFRTDSGGAPLFGFLLEELAGSRRRLPRRIVEVGGGEVSGRDAHGQGPLRGLARQRRGVEQECGNRAAQHSSARFPRDSQVLSSAAFGGWLYISTA